MLNRKPMQTLQTVALKPLLVLALATPLLAAEQTHAEELTCEEPAYQTFDKPTCFWPKDINPQCSSLSKDSIFYQCNVFDLSLGRDRERNDDQGRTYSSAIFKYSERNTCSTGDNDAISILGKCDTFAAYAQIFRNNETGRCYAFVNAALLGTQLKENSLRNSPNKVIQKLEIPGVSRRIIFTPSTDASILNQKSAVLVKTQQASRRFVSTGPSVSGLYFLELENTLTIKPDNLKPNPAKIRITRGVGTNSDYLDLPLNKGNEEALNRILSGCTS